MRWEFGTLRIVFFFMAMVACVAILIASSFFYIFSLPPMDQPVTFQVLGKDRGAELSQLLNQFFRKSHQYYTLEVQVGDQQDSYIGMTVGEDWYLLGYDEMASYALRYQQHDLQATLGDTWISFPQFEYALFTPRDHLLLLQRNQEELAPEAVFMELASSRQAIQMDLPATWMLPYLQPWISEGIEVIHWDESILRYLLIYEPYTYEIEEMHVILYSTSLEQEDSIFALRFNLKHDRGIGE
ncbi:hypothetical protein [Rubeoparvulum massiliense]|uniref:hypothetical protein n=1 Tax=Rubeoparvulum massiliense TaxID=1631346 RepID=UPI00065DEDD7|nr:hypothetical protein [Rubeoparvulum massiliense]